MRKKKRRPAPLEMTGGEQAVAALTEFTYGMVLILAFWAPVDEVASVEGDAEEIGGDEAELGGADADDAHNGAVDTGDDPALPELLANEHGGEHG